MLMCQYNKEKIKLNLKEAILCLKFNSMSIYTNTISFKEKISKYIEGKNDSHIFKGSFLYKIHSPVFHYPFWVLYLHSL